MADFLVRCFFEKVGIPDICVSLNHGRFHDFSLHPQASIACLLFHCTLDPIGCQLFFEIIFLPVISRPYLILYGKLYQLFYGAFPYGKLYHNKRKGLTLSVSPYCHRPCPHCGIISILILDFVPAVLHREPHKQVFFCFILLCYLYCITERV